MAMDYRKVAAGVALLLVSSAILVASGDVNATLPVYLVAAAAIGIATGSWLVGTAAEGRPA